MGKIVTGPTVVVYDVPALAGGHLQLRVLGPPER